MAKTPNRPLYMRHIRQALRAANKDFDERRYGFRGFLDLLHQGQREGSASLAARSPRRVANLPDHGQCACTNTAPAAGEPESALGAELSSEPEIDSTPPAPEPITEAIEVPDLVTPEVDSPAPEIGAQEVAGVEEAQPPAEPESSAPRKGRKRSTRPRTRKAGPKASR